MTTDLDRLVEKAQRGDERAFERLVAEVRPRVRRWAAAHVDSVDDAEDIVQTVLLKAHRGLAEFNFSSRFSTWLYAVTRRAAADWHRKRHRRGTLLEVRADPVEPAFQTRLRVDEQRLSAAVRTAFRSLPNRQREVFDLADLQGVPLTEIAEMLNMNPVTARVHLHRARATIRARVLAQSPALVEDYQ